MIILSRSAGHFGDHGEDDRGEGDPGDDRVPERVVLGAADERGDDERCGVARQYSPAVQRR